MFSMKQDSLLYEQVRKWINEGQNDKVKYILENTVLTDLPNNTSFLHIAAENDNSHIIEYLINRGLEVDIRNASNSTPLIHAVLSRKWAAVITLMEYNADILATDSKGYSALWYIGYIDMEIDEMSLQVLQMFFDRVRSKNVDNNQFVEIIREVSFDLDRLIYLHDAEVTKLYMDDLGPINVISEGYAVEVAMRTMDVDNLYVLLHYKDVDEAHERRVHFVNYLGKVLTDSRCDESLDVVVRMAVDKIVTWKLLDDESIRFLEKFFQEAPEVGLRKVLDDRLLSYIKSDFHYDVRVHMFGNPNPCVLQMIKNGEVDANAVSRKGRSALHIATFQNATENMKYLLNCGMNPNITDNNGKTAVFRVHVKQATSKDTLKLLLQHGADLQVTDQFGKICVDYHDNYDAGLAMTIIAHSAILEADGVPLKESLRNFCSTSNDTRNYFLMCLKQVEEMKGLDVDDSTKLFEVLSGGLENLIHRMRPLDRDIIDKFLIYNDSKLQLYDSYYVSTLRDRLIKAVTISELRKKAATVICESVDGLKRCALVIDKICNFLSYYDLHMFE